MADAKIKISALNQGTPLETDIIPYVDLATNTTKKALKSELKGDKGDTGDNATVDAGTTTTLAAGESATVTNVGTTSDAIFNFAIPQGIQGLTGADGACVESVSFVGNDMVFVLDDASTITLTNAKTDLKGDTGAKIVSGAFVGDDLVFTLDDNSTATVTNAKLDLKGSKGDDGDAATIAVGTVTTVNYGEPATVTNVGTSAAAVFDFNIPKGQDGTGSGDISGSGTANELAYFTAEKTIDNLPVDTYPSLTEVSYVKGVSSAIQTQLNGKQATGSYEVTTNKETSALDTSTTKYPCNNVVKVAVDSKVPTTRTLTINGTAYDLSADRSWTVSGGASLWTAVTGTRASNTTITVATDLTAIFKKGMIVRWQESGVDKVGMVSIPSTYSSPNTTITIIGDNCASIDTDSFKYSTILSVFKKSFAIAGNIGATGTDVANAWYADKPYKVIGAELSVGTAGTTNNTTIDINKAGTTMFTTKPTLASGVAFATTPFTADTATSLSLGDKITLDIDAVQTNPAQDLYADLILFETRFLTLS